MARVVVLLGSHAILTPLLVYGIYLLPKRFGNGEVAPESATVWFLLRSYCVVCQPPSRSCRDTRLIGFLLVFSCKVLLEEDRYGRKRPFFVLPDQLMLGEVHAQPRQELETKRRFRFLHRPFCSQLLLQRTRSLILCSIFSINDCIVPAVCGDLALLTIKMDHKFGMRAVSTSHSMSSKAIVINVFSGSPFVRVERNVIFLCAVSILPSLAWLILSHRAHLTHTTRVTCSQCAAPRGGRIAWSGSGRRGWRVKWRMRCPRMSRRG